MLFYSEWLLCMSWELWSLFIQVTPAFKGSVGRPIGKLAVLFLPTSNSHRTEHFAQKLKIDVKISLTGTKVAGNLWIGASANRQNVWQTTIQRSTSQKRQALSIFEYKCPWNVHVCNCKMIRSVVSGLVCKQKTLALEYTQFISERIALKLD